MPSLLLRVLTAAALLLASVAVDVDALDPEERDALLWFSIQEPEEAEELRAGIDADEEAAWAWFAEVSEAYRERVDELPRLARLVAAERVAVERIDSLSQSDDLSSSVGDERGALRAALEASFDARLALRRLALTERIAWANEGERDASGDRERLEEWLQIALEEASPESLTELHEERLEAWGHAFEELDEDLAEWWWELVETDPEGAAPTLARWQEDEPARVAQARAAGEGWIELLELESDLHRGLLAAGLDGLDRAERERQLEDLLASRAHPQLLALGERLVQADLRVERNERARERTELARQLQLLERRAVHRDVLVDVELLRRTHGEELLRW